MHCNNLIEIAATGIDQLKITYASSYQSCPAIKKFLLFLSWVDLVQNYA